MVKYSRLLVTFIYPPLNTPPHFYIYFHSLGHSLYLWVYKSNSRIHVEVIEYVCVQCRVHASETTVMVCKITLVFAVYHYTKSTVVHLSLRAGVHRKLSDPNVPFLCKAQVWHYISLLTDTASNGTSSRLNQALQKRVGQNGDQQTYSPVAARRWWESNVWGSRLSMCMCFLEAGDSVLGVFCPEFFRAKLLDE